MREKVIRLSRGRKESEEMESKNNRIKSKFNTPKAYKNDEKKQKKNKVFQNCQKKEEKIEKLG